MIAIIALIIIFLIGFVLRYRGMSELISLLLPSCIMPILILFDEFVLPYRGGGVSFWQIALAFGSFYGMMSSGFGVVCASYIINRQSKKT
jgi:hypothetical protein